LHSGNLRGCVEDLREAREENNIRHKEGRRRARKDKVTRCEILIFQGQKDGKDHARSICHKTFSTFSMSPAVNPSSY